MVESAAPDSSPPLFSTLPPGALLAVYSHAGISDLDPWAGRALARPRALVWPFRLEAAAEALEVIALALVMFIAVRTVVQNFVVDGASMVPAFRQGDLLVVNKLAYRSFDLSWLPWSDNRGWRPFGTPQRGDVLVFRYPRDPSRDFIKRVVALPGQTVEVRDGAVYVDGMRVEEPYIAQAPAYGYGPEVVAPGQFFVLGDNRNNSFDSHSWGMLGEDFLIGRADLRYWPLSALGLVDQHRPAVPAPQLQQAQPSAVPSSP